MERTVTSPAKYLVLDKLGFIFFNIIRNIKLFLSNTFRQYSVTSVPVETSKRKNAKRIPALVAGLFIAASAFSQDANGWLIISLKMDGGNTAYGVSAYYQLTTYGGVDVVLMKFVNHNEYPVAVTWSPAIFTNEHNWIKREDDAALHTITIGADSTVAADCSGAQPTMVFPLKDFPVVREDVFRYGVINFSVAKK